MKKKNGFTLTELLMVLVILFFVTSGAIVGTTTIQKRGNQKRLTALISEIELACDVYVNSHNEITDIILNNPGETECVKIYTLQGEGLIAKDLKNPVDNTYIPANLCVTVSNENGSIKSTFTYE